MIKYLFNDGRIDAWISGLGSFLGSLLAGLISAIVAVWIMKRQLKYQENSKKMQILKESINNYKLLVTNITILLEFLSTVKDSIVFLDHALYETYTNTLKNIKDRGEEIKTIIADFDRINDTLIDKDVIDQYLIIRMTNIYLINMINIVNEVGKNEQYERINKYIRSYIDCKKVFTDKINTLEKMIV